METLEDYQSRAELILSRCGPAPVIVVDLDYTLWPSNCFEHTLPPYSPFPLLEGGVSYEASSMEERASVHESGMLKTVYCLDARSKGHRSLELFEEAGEVLDFIHEHKMTLTICSKSPSKSVVEGILRAFGIWDWFVFPQIFNSRSKSYHFRNLCEATGLKMRDFLFFDDDQANISMCHRLGVTGYLVDKQTGLTWKTFLQGLEVFQSKQLSRRSFTLWLSSGSGKDQQGQQQQQQEGQEGVLSRCSSARSGSGQVLSSRTSPPSMNGSPSLPPIRQNSRGVSAKSFLSPLTLPKEQLSTPGGSEDSDSLSKISKLIESSSVDPLRSAKLPVRGGGQEEEEDDSNYGGAGMPHGVGSVATSSVDLLSELTDMKAVLTEPSPKGANDNNVRDSPDSLGDIAERLSGASSGSSSSSTSHPQPERQKVRQITSTISIPFIQC